MNTYIQPGQGRRERNLEEYCSAAHPISDSEVGVGHCHHDFPSGVLVNLFVDLGNRHVHHSIPNAFPPLYVFVCLGGFLETVLFVSFSMCFIFAELVANNSVLLSLAIFSHYILVFRLIFRLKLFASSWRDSSITVSMSSSTVLFSISDFGDIVLSVHFVLCLMIRVPFIIVNIKLYITMCQLQ